MLTLSVPTSPDAPEPSPYVIFHVAPAVFLKVLDFLGSKTLWPEELIDLGNSVERTCTRVRTDGRSCA